MFFISDDEPVDVFEVFACGVHLFQWFVGLRPCCEDCKSVEAEFFGMGISCATFNGVVVDDEVGGASSSFCVRSQSVISWS